MRSTGPHTRFRAVHVGGTNGKGSVCGADRTHAARGGLRTGLTTSPHLVDFRERIRIAGRWLGEDELEARLDHIQGLEAARGRTFFEIATVLGFDALARHRVEWAVVEVGLGGRLDATNVLDPRWRRSRRSGSTTPRSWGTTWRRSRARRRGS